MAHIPGLNYVQPKAKSKPSKAAGRQCQVMELERGRCVVSFTLKGATQRAVLPLDRLYSDQGPCARQRPPVVGEKLLCDMTPVENTAVSAQWLVAFAWRGKLDSAPKSGPLSGVTGMLSEVGPDSGVLLFVSAGGCRERCAFGRAAVQPEGSPLPASEPLSRHLETGETVLFDCRPTTTAPHCRWLADKVWVSAAPDDCYYEEEEEEEEEEGTLMVGERGEFILRETLKAIVGRVDLVVNYKAVLTFDHAGQRHRALLLTAKYKFPEKATAVERRDLTKVLSRGDQVLFTCHEYDKPNGTDRCGWWVMEAVRLETERAVGREAGYFQSGHLYEKIGTVKEVLAAEGLLHFVLDGRREVAWFSAREVFINGRPCEGRLSDALESGQRVHFNAERSPAPRGADWRCICVWRGEMPTVEASQKRIEAAVVKKQKKSKAARSRIDDLDDFELPAAPGSGGGDGWPAATVHVPQPSPHHSARPHLGGGDRGGRAGRQTRLRASMVDALDDLEPAEGGSGGTAVTGISGSTGVDWTLGVGGGGSWADEPDLLTAEEAAPESVSSGPSRPLSDASLEHGLGPAQSPGRPPLVPLLEHSVPLPDPSLPRPPLLPTPESRLARSAAETPPPSSQSRPPPGLSSAGRQGGLSPAALAAAAAANYQQQQRAAGLLGEPPAPQRAGLLPTPPLYGYPAYWQPGLLLYGPGPAPPPAMPPLSVDRQSLEQMVRSGRLPSPAATSQSRSVPAADWEAAAAAFQAAPAPAPAAQGRSSPTLESVQRRPSPAPEDTSLELLSARLEAAALEQEQEPPENGLDDLLGELEPENGHHSPPPPDVDPVSGRGQILAFVDESRGLAEWDQGGHVQQVMFDRHVCYWMGARMDTLDLTDCYTPGAEVVFQCVPAGPDEPYQWVATHFEQVED